METRAEADVALLRVHRDVAELVVLVGGNHDVDGLNGVTEVLVALLEVGVQLEEDTVKLVDEEDRFDALGNGLTQHSLGLDAHTLDTVDDLQRQQKVRRTDHINRKRHLIRDGGG